MAATTFGGAITSCGTIPLPSLSLVARGSSYQRCRGQPRNGDLSAVRQVGNKTLVGGVCTCESAWQTHLADKGG